MRDAVVVGSTTREPRHLQNAQPFRVAYEPLAPAVSIWWRPLVASAEAIARFAATLSHEETARASRFGPPALRERYIIGRGTLRVLLSNALGIAPETVPIVRSHRGRPVVHGIPGVDFNVSHTRDIAVYAVGVALPESVRLGVDVEHADRVVDAERLARKVLTIRERERLATLPESDRRLAFLAAWTCKEAMSKATGDGLSAPFGKITVDGADPPRAIDGPFAYEPSRWQLHRVTLPGNFLVTIAMLRPSTDSRVTTLGVECS